MAANQAGSGREFGQLDTKQLKLSAKDPWYDLLQNLNRLLRKLYLRCDSLEGARGPISLAADINLNEHVVTSSGDAVNPGDLVSLSFATAHYGAVAMADALSLGGANPLNVSGLRGQLYQAQPAAIPRGNPSSLPPGALDGQMFLSGTVLYRVDASVSPPVAVQVSTTGDVIGPSSAVADDIATFNGTTGKLIKDGGKKIADLVLGNAPISPGTNLKITYDAKGLVTAGAAATLASADYANQGTTTTVLHGNAAGNPSFAAVSLTADVTGTLPVANGGTAVTYDRVFAVVDLTAQTATVGPTTMAAAGSQFLFSYSLLVTTADALSVATIQVSVNYTDDIGATSQSGSAVAVAATNRERGTFVIERASGNVTYTVTLVGVIGTAQYAFHATLQRFS